jgi:hypothetical protein
MENPTSGYVILGFIAMPLLARFAMFVRRLPRIDRRGRKSRPA